MHVLTSISNDIICCTQKKKDMTVETLNPNLALQAQGRGKGLLLELLNYYPLFDTFSKKVFILGRRGIL